MKLIYFLIKWDTYSSLLILGVCRNPLCSSQRSDTFWMLVGGVLE